MQAVPLPLSTRPWRRWIDSAASAAFLAALAVLACLVLGIGSGYRVLIERSDSMAPVLRAGDLIVTKNKAAAEASVGEIVTFTDPSTREGVLITHRVVRKQAKDSTVAFVTRGDANSGVERWTATADGTVGGLTWRIPKVGYAVSWLALPAIRLLLMSLGGLILAALLLRRIWTN